ncbi:chromosome segregation protein ParM [Cronobacter turicensis]|nr:chromosome segregation protein ParM [Klebsiella pneumoniae]
MRISSNQKAILIALYAIALKRGVNPPLSLMELLNIINAGRDRKIADTNFRTSCHTLVKHGLLYKHRDLDSLQLSFSLTQEGENTAYPLYQKLLKAGDNDG